MHTIAAGAIVTNPSRCVRHVEGNPNVTQVSKRGTARKKETHHNKSPRAGGTSRTKSVPSELPPCPATASMLSGLAVEPILDILSDRL
jgi:hypothetical protein